MISDGRRVKAAGAPCAQTSRFRQNRFEQRRNRGPGAAPKRFPDGFDERAEPDGEHRPRFAFYVGRGDIDASFTRGPMRPPWMKMIR
jgi:hypothetical protein